MKQVPLTDEEFKFAVLSKDENEMQLAVAEFNIKQGKRSIELNLPARAAARDIAQKEEELQRVKLNKKFFDKLVRNKFREEPVQEE